MLKLFNHYLINKQSGWSRVKAQPLPWHSASQSLDYPQTCPAAAYRCCKDLVNSIREFRLNQSYTFRNQYTLLHQGPASNTFD